jgi:ABC-type Fe3+/spermidine/putrescine transport system ATPase subunit
MALAGSVRIKLPQPFPPGGRILLMIRPHRVAVGGPEAAAVGDDRQALAGVVARKSFLGNTMEVEVRTDAGALIAETNAGAADWGALKPGSPVVLSWDIQDSLVFPDDRAAA